MTEHAQTRTIIPGQDHDDRELMQIVLHSEKEGRIVDRPARAPVARQLRRVVHSIVAQRLIEARNRSGINNERINALMHSLYLERRRDPKGWAFSNSVAKKNTYLPDEEEVEMLASILPVDIADISIHLKVVPWALEDQKAEHDERRRKENARRNPIQTKEPTMTTTTSAPRPTDVPSPSGRARTSAGDLKISHNSDGIHVHGKVWCDRHVAQRLRMIVPLKLIQQAHGDNPWCYEMKGRVHDYQLYNLMHVLYGAPRVLKVELD